MGRIAWSMPTYDVLRPCRTYRVRSGIGTETTRPATEIESCQGGEGTSNEPTHNRNRVVSRGGGDQQRADP
eukprot:9476142-Pyramimonas_sp.AAC.2